MITNLLLRKGGYNKGYLPKAASPAIQPVFATANLAIRREALAEIGEFDERLGTGEDIDLGLRLAKTQWSQYFEHRAVVFHKHRTTLRALLKQWFDYGWNHGTVFKKHLDGRCLELCWPHSNGTEWRSFRVSRVFGVSMPFSALVFATPFHLFHLSLVLTVVCGFSDLVLLKWVCAAAAAYYAHRHFLSAFDRGSPGRWLIFSGIRYLLNVVYVAGGFFGGLRVGILYLEATREHNTTSVE